MINEVFAVSAKAKPRDVASVGLKLLEEAGEFAKEVNIVNGYVNKPAGEDGVIGEACDVIMCVLDMVKLCYGNSVTAEMIEAKMMQKLLKWELDIFKEEEL